MAAPTTPVSSNGKGDRDRTRNKAAFDSGYENIFGKKREPIPYRMVKPLGGAWVKSNAHSKKRPLELNGNDAAGMDQFARERGGNWVRH